MRVLVLGAAGFIGRHVVAELLAAGCQVVGCVRRPDVFRRRFPSAETIGSDLARDLDASVWLPRLQGIDVIVNLAGVLRGRTARSVHLDMPKALHAAAEAAGVRRVVLVSAISASESVDTDYARTKLAGERALRDSPLDWVILRPSLIYAEGAYGGTALLRALAAFPGAIPVPGDGGQLFQPLHAEDLARTILLSLDRPDLSRQILSPVGPEVLTLAELARRWRAWLGLPSAPLLKIPRPLMALAAHIGDLLPSGPLSTTSLRQLHHGNTGDAEAFQAVIGFTPRRFDDALATRPAQVQELWHARLYLLRPLLRLGLAAIWLASGLVGLLQSPQTLRDLGETMGLPGPLALGASWLGSGVDLLLGILLLVRPRLRGLTAAQLSVLLTYTLGLTLLWPGLWLDPFGPLLKNLAVLLLMLIVAALAEDR